MRKGVRAALGELSVAFGSSFETAAEIVQQHASRTSWVAPQYPDGVLWVSTENQVRQAVQLCARHDCPIIPFGAGTSFEGSVNAPDGGISIDFSRMNAIQAIHEDDFDCVIEPGITRLALQARLRERGLFFPVDPGSDASLGGMASTRASGTNAARLGTMKDNVLALRVVLPNGEVIATSRRARKSAAGYDLTRLFIGAEGTLGLITQLTLKLLAVPPFTAAATCSFPSIEACCAAFVAAAKAGLSPARVELLDEVQIAACNRYSNLTLEPNPTLFLEFNGTETAASEQARCFGDLAMSLGGGRFQWSASEEERAALWNARNNAFWATQNLRPNSKILVTDVCLPVSRLAECLAETKRDIEASGLVAPIVAHVGDGNFHAQVLVDMDDGDEIDRARAFVDRLITRALAMEGTCTGEHGIGQGKRKYLVAEHGSEAIALMACLKRAIDPANIMNPGKIFDFGETADRVA